MTDKRSSSPCTRLAAIFFAMLFAGSTLAASQSEWLVHSFGSVAQGLYPMGNLVADSSGNLYGTTEEGGSSQGWGTVYELVRPVPPKTAWTEIVLYSFTGGADGSTPLAGLIFDDAGNLYGTTSQGGTAGAGTVFELAAPTTPGGAWTENVIHSFQGGAADGATIETEVVWDHSGNLYGVTLQGGTGTGTACSGGCGTVFHLLPPPTPGGGLDGNDNPRLHVRTGCLSEGSSRCRCGRHFLRHDLPGRSESRGSDLPSYAPSKPRRILDLPRAPRLHSRAGRWRAYRCSHPPRQRSSLRYHRNWREIRSGHGLSVHPSRGSGRRFLDRKHSL